MRRRELIIGSLSLVAFAVACGHTQVEGQSAGYKEILAAGNGSETVLVCMPDTPQTREVWRGLSDELGQDFKLVAVRVAGRGDAELIARGVREHNPSALVLMNNPTVGAYKAYTKLPEARKLPAVVVMTSFLEGGALQAIGATGISYEVPLITVVTNLRKLLAVPLERVGVVYREPLAGFVAQQVELAQREKIRVVEVRLPAEPNPAHIKAALRETKRRADAVWILNDDKLLSPRLIADGWLPGLNERPWRPTIVGAASLVSSAQSFGTLAVMPDHTALGVQTANLVFDIADNDWKIPSTYTQLPLSTTTTVDLRQAKERFTLRAGALAQVDRIIE